MFVNLYASITYTIQCVIYISTSVLIIPQKSTCKFPKTLGSHDCSAIDLKSPPELWNISFVCTYVCVCVLSKRISKSKATLCLAVKKLYSLNGSVG